MVHVAGHGNIKGYTVETSKLPSLLIIHNWSKAEKTYSEESLRQVSFD